MAREGMRSGEALAEAQRETGDETGQRPWSPVQGGSGWHYLVRSLNFVSKGMDLGRHYSRKGDVVRLPL